MRSVTSLRLPCTTTVEPSPAAVAGSCARTGCASAAMTKAEAVMASRVTRPPKIMHRGIFTRDISGSPVPALFPACPAAFFAGHAFTLKRDLPDTPDCPRRTVRIVDNLARRIDQHDRPRFGIVARPGLDA